MDLNKLNSNNYHVFEDNTDDHWYAQNGLRSLYVYSKISNKSFRYICETLLNRGEVTIYDTRPNSEGLLTLTMI